MPFSRGQGADGFGSLYAFFAKTLVITVPSQITKHVIASEIVTLPVNTEAQWCRSMQPVPKQLAKSWSSTLSLPKSTFPARTAPADRIKYLERCTDDLYGWQRRERPASDPFILHDGPPYANGDLHVGHALNKILKDTICRTKLQQGRKVDYTPGWDCHGLPIELKALEDHGWKRGYDVDSVAIRGAARKFAETTIAKQMAGFKSWGIMGDWKNHWKTMDKSFELRQLAVFQAMAKSGLIYRRHKPVYWSPSSRTALAEAELEYNENHISTAALVKFPVRLPWQQDDDRPVFAVIWTTTPWTLPANQAIAINRNLRYVWVRSQTHGDLILGASRSRFVEELVGEQFETINHDVDPEILLLGTYEPLFAPKSSLDTQPIVHADFVSSDAGTGLVHCAPGHGMEDHEALQALIRSGRISVKVPVDESGCFTKDASPVEPHLLEGKDVLGSGNACVLQSLGERRLLLGQHDYKHKYPYDWRTKEPILIRATAQWFADVSSIQDEALYALEDVRFHPSTGKSRLQSFVQNRSEWCISRQRAWGVPIPALYHKETGDAVLSDASVSHIVKIIESRGIDSWWSDTPSERAWIVPELAADKYRRGTDTMDVWFDSGTSWTGMADFQGSSTGPKAEIYIEGTDQHRGWFQSSLLTKIAFQKSQGHQGVPSAPFANLITHGFTLDAAGKKMSKSVGNVVSPNQIISGVFSAQPELVTASKKSKKSKHDSLPLGADALRLWALSSDWTKDVVVSDSVVRTAHTTLHKYRVTFKLLLGALEGFDPQFQLAYTDLHQTDKLALWHLYSTVSTVRAAFEDFEYHKAVTAINQWVYTDLSAVYIEAVKDVLYCGSPTGLRRCSVQTTLFHLLCQMQSMLAPMLPMLVEESWEHSPKSIKGTCQHPLQRRREDLPEEWNDQAIRQWQSNFHDLVNATVKALQEEARSQKKMGSSLECDCYLYVNRPEADDPTDGWINSVTAGLFTSSALAELLVVSKLVVLEPSDLGNVDHAKGLLRDRGWPRPSEKLKPENGWSCAKDILDHEGNTLGFAVITQPGGLKCPRCWKYVVEKPGDEGQHRGEHDERKDLCGRCEAVIDELESVQ